MVLFRPPKGPWEVLDIVSGFLNELVWIVGFLKATHSKTHNSKALSFASQVHRFNTSSPSPWRLRGEVPFFFFGSFLLFFWCFMVLFLFLCFMVFVCCFWFYGVLWFFLLVFCVLGSFFS